MIPSIKKYAKYVGIVVAGVFLVLGYVFITSWLKRTRIGGEGLSGRTENLKDVLNEVGNKMSEAKMQADVEVAVARGKEQALKEELRDVVNLKDRRLRRHRLANMKRRLR